MTIGVLCEKQCYAGKEGATIDLAGKQSHLDSSFTKVDRRRRDDSEKENLRNREIGKFTFGNWLRQGRSHTRSPPYNRKSA